MCDPRHRQTDQIPASAFCTPQALLRGPPALLEERERNIDWMTGYRGDFSCGFSVCERVCLTGFLGMASLASLFSCQVVLKAGECQVVSAREHERVFNLPAPAGEGGNATHRCGAQNGST